ncbi:NAD(P)-binding domain-containing protein [Noviherbaspirillum massiliense]|uniref:NAD(P)-binding domain-containing protein n=1 Tax=Noviherbaspirillum massiliense TaxID=1465823 RepID=UPI00031DF2D8|nr:NAD(P)-binding domain-containing protein [Noviherbaspirillum massiliense]
MNRATDVTIVGAGPYGLSIAAHLRKYGVDFRIIGIPMHGWLANMPKGMLLKSAGFSSNLYDPDASYPLSQYCKEHGVPYEDVDFPIPLETFCDYGLAFQKRFVPNLEEDKVAVINPTGYGYEVRLQGGEVFATSRVVVAVGLDYFRHIPQVLQSLPHEMVSHSAEHSELLKFQGRDVAVLGSGSSATDIAILLHENQTKVKLIARKPEINFGNPWKNGADTFLKRLRLPISGIGPGWESKIWCEMPWIYRYLPDDKRRVHATRYLGPSGGWFMKERARNVPALLGYELKGASAHNGQVRLDLVAMDGSTRNIVADHVIAATGYKADIKRISFLNDAIVEKLDLLGSTPSLSLHFESSMPGLYFTGPIAATSFGPVMRFAAGANFASRNIARHLARSKGRRPSWDKRKPGEAVVSHRT